MEIPKQLQNNEYRFTLLNGKIPIEREWQNTNNHTYNSDKLLSHRNNAGVVCGKGGLVVIDIDGNPLNTLEKIYEFLPKTYTVKTGKQGFHIYYVADEKINSTAFDFNKSHIDIKADRGQVVMEGSTHPETKKKYICYYDEPIAKISKKEIETLFGIKQEAGHTKKIKNDSNINKPKAQIQDDESRSAIEYSNVCSLISKGKTKDQIFDYMNAFEKWRNSDDRYKEHTYNKAFNFIQNSKYEPIDESNIRYRLFELLSDNDKETREQSKLEAQEILIDFLRDKFKVRTIMQDEKLEVWAYNQGIYENKGISLIREETRKILQKSYNESFVKQILNKITADTYIDPSSFFRKEEPYLLPVKNGLLDIKSGELKEFTSEKIFFSKIPVEYHPNAQCPTIIKHLKNSLKSEEDIILFQEALGNCLLKKYTFQKAVMLVGSGRNGKGITLDVIRNLLGIENISAITLEQIENDQYSISELHGKLANIGGDLNSTSLKRTGIFKSASGGDVLSAPRKFLPPMVFTNHAKFFFACNSLPRIYDDSRGFWERWLYFEFPYTFTTKEEYMQLEENEKENYKIADPLITEKLLQKSELEGLLVFALEGLYRLLENNKFSNSPTFMEVKQKWVNQSDSFSAFCEKYIETDFDCEISKDDLKKNYFEYCKENKAKLLSDKHIFSILTTQYGADIKQKTDSLGTKYRVWTGVRLK